MGESVGTEFTRVIRQSLRGFNNSTIDKYGRGSRHTWLSKEQIATIRYIMQHPDIRPSAWTSSGHGDVEATDSARNIVDEKSIVPEKTKEKAHQESTAVSAVNNE